MCIAHSSVHNMDQKKHNKKCIHVESGKEKEKGKVTRINNNNNNNGKILEGRLRKEIFDLTFLFRDLIKNVFHQRLKLLTSGQTSAFAKYFNSKSFRISLLKGLVSEFVCLHSLSIIYFIIHSDLLCFCRLA